MAPRLHSSIERAAPRSHRERLREPALRRLGNLLRGLAYEVAEVRPRTAARSLAIGSPADGDLAVETARATGGAIHAVPEEEIGENMGLLAERSGVFGETAAGVTLGALREAVRRGDVGGHDRVVLLVTGDGLKTPGPVAERLRPVEIEPNADQLLASLQTA